MRRSTGDRTLIPWIWSESTVTHGRPWAHASRFHGFGWVKVPRYQHFTRFLNPHPGVLRPPVPLPVEERGKGAIPTFQSWFHQNPQSTFQHFMLRVCDSEHETLGVNYFFCLCPVIFYFNPKLVRKVLSRQPNPLATRRLGYDRHEHLPHHNLRHGR